MCRWCLTSNANNSRSFEYKQVHQKNWAQITYFQTIHTIIWHYTGTHTNSRVHTNSVIHTDTKPYRRVCHKIVKTFSDKYGALDFPFWSIRQTTIFYAFSLIHSVVCMCLCAWMQDCVLFMRMNFAFELVFGLTSDQRILCNVYNLYAISIANES